LLIDISENCERKSLATKVDKGIVP